MDSKTSMSFKNICMASRSKAGIYVCEHRTLLTHNNQQTPTPNPNKSRITPRTYPIKQRPGVVRHTASPVPQRSLLALLLLVTVVDTRPLHVYMFRRRAGRGALVWFRTRQRLYRQGWYIRSGSSMLGEMVFSSSAWPKSWLVGEKGRLHSVRRRARFKS